MMVNPFFFTLPSLPFAFDFLFLHRLVFPDPTGTVKIIIHE